MIQDPAIYIRDADVPIPWNDILQIVLPINSSLHTLPPTQTHGPVELSGRNGGHPNCPICLEVPRSARMARCGHTYCYPCILHFLELSEHSYGPTQRDNKYQPCPVCGEGIWARELKSVRFWDYDDPSLTAGSPPSETVSADSTKRLMGILRMRLMSRSSTRTVSLPTPTQSSAECEPISTAQLALELTTSNADALKFSKFAIATSDYYLSSLRRDIEDLNQLDKEASGDSIERGFVDRVRAKVEREIARVINDVEMGTWDVLPDKSIPVVGGTPGKWGRKKNDFDTRSEGAVTPVEKQTVYNFYQAASGEPLYLSPLDYRLVKEQADSQPLPLEISVPVEHVEWLSVGEDSRRRYKWLGGGTALTSEVGFVEIAGDELERVQRRTRREERMRAEEKRQKAKEKEAAMRSQDRADEEGWLDRIWNGLPSLLPDDGVGFDGPRVDDEKQFVQLPRRTEPQTEDGGPTTVWGTRAVPVSSIVVQGGELRGREEEDDELRERRRRREELEAAWRTLEDNVLFEQVVEDKDKKGRKKKKKTVLSLAGGGAVMGRR
ncbi:hypothetical protein BT69DRAFT_1351176 [Atractiella rhizophila]|nr:hypothetical protein BT69DRAFT_1351176 [Atractiella rhizophila]